MERICFLVLQDQGDVTLLKQVSRLPQRTKNNKDFRLCGLCVATTQLSFKSESGRRQYINICLRQFQENLIQKNGQVWPPGQSLLTLPLDNKWPVLI